MKRTVRSIIFIFICFQLVFYKPCTARNMDYETDDFDFDGLPGAAHEFKIYVNAGYQECFYQKIKQNGKFYVSFEVLRGGDMLATLYLAKIEPGGYLSVLQSTESITRGGFQHGPFEKTDVYAICIDNRHSLLATKLVFVYLVAYVEEEWTAYMDELNDIQMSYTNFTSIIHNTTEAIAATQRLIAAGRMHIIKDYYLLLNNNMYVQRYSIAQCVVIVICSFMQVFFLRRLFRTPAHVTPSRKPRA